MAFPTPNASSLSPASENAETLYKKGLTSFTSRDDYQARIFFEECLKIDPGHFYALVNLGAVFLRTNRINMARTCYRKALKIDPENAGILNEIGSCYRAEGDVEKAIAYYEKALKLEPDRIGTLYNLVHMQPLKTDSLPAQQLKKLYASSDCSADDRVLAGFALAKMYEYHADHQRAFQYYAEANALQFSLCGYNEAEYFAFFDQLEKVFTPDLFKRLANTQPPAGITPVFVLGMPRSGTSLVEHILASHSGVYGAGEVTIMTSIADHLVHQNPAIPFPRIIECVGTSILESLSDLYIRNLSVYCPDESRIVVDKMPNNFFMVGLIRLLFPKSPIIHCVRDPMDTCWSLFRLRFDGVHGYCYDQGTLGRYYRRYQRLMAHWHAVLPGSIHDVSYEQLVENPEPIVRAMLDYCELSWEDKCLHFYRTKRVISTASAAQVRRPIYKSSMRAWSPVANELAPLQAALNGL